MTIELLEAAAAALGDLRERVVFLERLALRCQMGAFGARRPGCCLEPLTTKTGEADFERYDIEDQTALAVAVGATYDVDVVAEVTTLGAYASFQEELRQHGFADRGKDDCLASRDFEDIVLLVDGRGELAGELDALPEDARDYVRGEFSRILDLPSFEYGVEGALGASDARDRARAVTIPRFERLAGP